MRRRRPVSFAPLIWMLSGIGLALAVGLAAMLATMPARRVNTPQSRVTYANYRKVRDGMTRKEVVAILGKSYTSAFEWNFPEETNIGDFEALQWAQSKDAVAVIGFHKGRVIYRSHAGLK